MEYLQLSGGVVFYAMGMAYGGANLKMLFPLSSGYHWSILR